MARLRKINKKIDVITDYDWAVWGFVPEEIRELRGITWDGINRPYFQSLLNHRRSMKSNFMRWNKGHLDFNKYRTAVLDDYDKKIGKRSLHYQAVWDYFYTWKTDPKYPKIKSGSRKQYKPRLKGKENRTVSVTKQDQLRQRIAQNKADYIKAVQQNDQIARARLQKEYNALERELLNG